MSSAFKASSTIIVANLDRAGPFYLTVYVWRTPYTLRMVLPLRTYGFNGQADMDAVCALPWITEWGKVAATETLLKTTR